MTRGSPQLPPRSLRHHRKEQERGENRQVDDSLQHRRAAGAERDHADDDGQRQQHLLSPAVLSACRTLLPSRSQL